MPTEMWWTPTSHRTRTIARCRFAGRKTEEHHLTTEETTMPRDCNGRTRGVFFLLHPVLDELSNWRNAWDPSS